MSPRSFPRRSVHPPADAHPGATALPLWPLVETIDAALADIPDSDCVLVHIAGPPAGTPGDVELGWRPLDGVHPLEALTGLVAPAHWHALGFTGSATLRSIDGDSDEASRARVTVLVDRHGAAASCLRADGQLAQLDESPQGPSADAVRRALGLPTAPAPASTAALWTLVWLERLVATALPARPDDPGLDWATAAGLHPAVIADGEVRRACAPESLAAAAVDLGDAWPWWRLRTGGHGLDVGPAEPPTDVAAWMDDGMFARHLVAGLPALADLLDACDGALAAVVAARVTATVLATFELGGER